MESDDADFDKMQGVKYCGMEWQDGNIENKRGRHHDEKEFPVVFIPHDR
jgi:hypothetical protein